MGYTRSPPRLMLREMNYTFVTGDTAIPSTIFATLYRVAAGVRPYAKSIFRGNSSIGFIFRALMGIDVRILRLDLRWGFFTGNTRLPPFSSESRVISLPTNRCGDSEDDIQYDYRAGEKKRGGAPGGPPRRKSPARMAGATLLDTTRKSAARWLLSGLPSGPPGAQSTRSTRERTTRFVAAGRSIGPEA